MRFPSVTGSSLEGQEYQLPDNFEGELNLVLIAFQRWQQDEIDSWLPLAQMLAAELPDFYYYELPTIYRGNPLFRLWLDTVMRSGIPDRKARAATITLYLDKPQFRQLLGLPTEDTIYALLVKRGGEILWRSEGRCTEQKQQALNEAINRALV